VVQIPLEEYPGYSVYRTSRFDVDLLADSSESGIKLGWVQDVGSPTGQAYFIEPAMLTGHVLVAGTTDSGKTNTTFNILGEISNQGIPFLIIEPTKGEYRYLRATFPKLEVYTMGSNEYPLQMNPFFVPPSVTVQMHLDYLQSLFAASFVLYAPMPYVLEAALVEIYEDKGWDLAQDICLRDSQPGMRAFPTLTDLYDKVEGVATRFGYEERIRRDIIAALRARVNSLRLGSKGAMLDTREPFDFAAIMKKPIVIEMGKIASEEQKAFLIGLLLVRLYEHYIAGGVQVTSVKTRHVTVIEEAHRLLQNRIQGQSGDFANPQGKAIELFSNIITEIRGYGEGLVIVEQSPAKLAPDVVKNTNIKLIHRIISADDRDVLGRVMNMGEEELQSLVSLPKGNAILFTPGMDRPMRLRVIESKKRLTDGAGSVSLPESRPSGEKRLGMASRLADDPGLQREFLRWVFITAFHPEARAANLERLINRIRATVPIALRDQKMELEIVPRSGNLLADRIATRFGQYYSWTFAQEEKFLDLLVKCWSASDASHADAIANNLEKDTRVVITPYDLCASCESPCLFRLFAREIRGGDISGELAAFHNKRIPETFMTVYLALARAASDIGIPGSSQWKGLLFCTAVHEMVRMDMTEPQKMELAVQVAQGLKGMK
jgi:hypothetical protein